MRYPGNTVVADIEKDGAALLRGPAEALRPYGESLIFLTESSYHVTLLRGVNDLVRRPGFWPPAWPLDLEMDEADRRVAEAVMAARLPGPLRFKISGASMDDADVRVTLTPWDEQEASALRLFRDAAADRLSLRLPGHENYVFHVTLAYVRLRLGERRAEALRALMNALPIGKTVFVSRPYMAYYEDMTAFCRTRREARRAYEEA